ncbi:hypothetical protein [Kineococcus rhizosphaerae]|uniref:Leucine rich repeat (LRR) protein n=1 Tax=Kineococcus rhizosphaerae TaxID=559628 RepID=A0A2T0R4T5_9ACTN|nr:hypothetical protein [Kineococcus rhizosphaerae]PRY15376.1 hypothetical protein CLV37_105304 [Kineococcus rhizosphaerae]
MSVRRALAENTACPEAVLINLLADRNWDVRHAAATSTSATARVHQAAINDAPNDVGRNVAQLGDQLSEATIELIIGHPAVVLRADLAETTLDPVVLQRLSSDTSPRVRASAAANAGTARFFQKTTLLPVVDTVLEQLSQDSRSEVRAVVAESEDLPVEAVRRLAQDSSAVVRWWTLVHHAEDEVIARQLLDDSDPTNATQAAANLKSLRPPRQRAD